MSLSSFMVLACCLSFACVGQVSRAASGDTPPDAGKIENFIALTLPGYWKVERLSLTDPVDYGNQVEPEWRWRFEAVITPNEALFVEADRDGDIVLLEPGLDPESRQTLYGIVVTTFRAGEWSGDIRHENRPFDHGGKPASFFAGRTLVVGSAEERELRDKTQERALEKLEATHEAERAALKLAQEAALARIGDMHRTALARLASEHDADMKRREAEHHKKVAGASAQHMDQLAQLEVELKAEAKRRRLEISESQKLTELTSEATRRLDALHDAESGMLAASERVFAARATALKELVDTLGMVTKVDGYLALLDTASESELDWMHVAVLRHGLQDDNSDIRNAARLDLLGADLESKPRLHALLKERLERIGDRPELQDFLAKHASGFISNHALRNLLLDHLPFVQQWASRVVDASPSYGDRHSPEWALGEPSVVQCNPRANKMDWAPNGGGTQFIRVAFEIAVLFPRIDVYEISKCGFVRKIILSDGKGYDTTYEVEDKLKQCPGTSAFRLYEPASTANASCTRNSSCRGSKSSFGRNEKRRRPRGNGRESPFDKPPCFRCTSRTRS